MKKKTIKTLGTIGSISGVALLAVSCGTSKPALDKSLIADVQKDGKTIGKIALDKFYEDLIAKNKSDVAKRVQDIIKKSAKFLYEKEVTGSEFLKKIREDQMTDKEKKNANIQTLDSISKIEDRVRAEFEDTKEAFKKSHGYGYEEAWKKELLSNSTYSNATSDAQAIDNMVLKQLVASAYNRYTIKQDSDTWTKDDVERGNPAKKDPKQKDWEWLWNLKEAGFVYSSDKTSTYDQLIGTQKVILVSTASNDVDFKNPTEIIGGTGKNGYLNHYDPTVMNHFLLPAIPDPKKVLAPWKVKIEDAKKWLMSTTATGTPHAALDDVNKFIGLTYKDAGKPTEEFNVTKNDEILLKTIAGNQPQTQKAGGSLGFKDELSYVKTMDPGFGFTILNKALGANKFEISKTNPLKGLAKKIIDKLADKIGIKWDNPANSEDWSKELIALFDNVGKDEAIQIIGREFRDAFQNAKNDKRRHVAYEVAPASGTEPARYAITSKFGVHIISRRVIDNKDEVIKMLKSDVVRTTRGEIAYFNVLTELNQYSSDKMLIVKDLLKMKDFTDWLKTRPNYNNMADGNTYPDYTQADIDYLQQKAIKGYEATLISTRVTTSITNTKTWIVEAYMNETIVAGGTDPDAKNPIWTKSLQNIYNAAMGIAEEGVIK